MVDIIPLSLIILIIIVSVVNGKTEYKKNISFTTTQCAKGLFALMIILYHYPGGEEHILLKIIDDTGYLSVGAFYFLSGYGLTAQFKSKGHNYLVNAKSFFSGKMKRIMMPWFMVSVFYLLFWIVLGGKELLLLRCNRPENAFLLIPQSWFVIVISVFYILFYLSFKIFKGRVIGQQNDYAKSLNMAGGGKLLIFVLLWIAFARIIGLGAWWYYSVLCFPIGCFYCIEEQRISRKFSWLLIVVFSLFFILCYLLRQYNSNHFHVEWIWIMAHLGASASFVVVVMSLFKNVNIECNILSFWGSISYEIYLIHLVWIELLRSKYIYIPSDFLYLVFIIACSVVSALAIHKITPKLERNKDSLNVKRL